MPIYYQLPPGWCAEFSVCVDFAGAALFTVFVKGAGFSFLQNRQCALKERIGIDQMEGENRGSENPHP
jgi:hypothetical protein